MAFPIALAAAGLGGLFGIGQKLQASRIEKNNPFQARTVNSLIAGNAAQAQNQARIGIAEQQYQNALNQQNQNLSNILGVASRSGRNIPLAGLLRQSNLATQNLNSQDAQARQQNQRFAMQQNQVLAQEQQNVRKYNVEDPYMRKMQQAAELRNAGNQNIFGALGMAAQSSMMSGLNNTNVNGTSGQGNFFNTLNTYGRQNFGLGGRLG